MGTLYYQIRKRYPGTLELLIGFLVSTTGQFLLFGRNTIPDWASIILANFLVILSFYFFLKGFQKFVQIKNSHIPNYILIVGFMLVHIYYTYFDHNLHARNLNLAIYFIPLSFQIAYLLLKKVSVEMRKITIWVGVVFCLLGIFMIIRLVYLFQNVSPNNDYFQSGSSEGIYYSGLILFFMLIAYSSALMYNRRLVKEVIIQEEKYSLAFKSAPFLICLTRVSDKVVVEVNNYFQKITGFNPKEIIGFESSEIKLWYDVRDREAYFSELLNERIVTENEYEFRKKSGEIYTVLISAEIININNEEYIISVINDITERKKAEIVLKNSEITLKELNASKDKFFSIIAHDLKSPFNGILGFSEILYERTKQKDYEGIEGFAEVIQISSRHAVDLLSNLMEWARSQSGRMEFNPEYIEISGLLDETLEVLNISALQKSIPITIQKISNNLIVFADKLMLQTVLRNLISNAIKYTKAQGEIIISIEEKATEFLFSIKDSGVGIDKDNIDKLFRIESSFSLEGTENEKGTGLGLILCKDFIEKHKGKIYVESKLGVGSTFYFTLPKAVIK